jgi:hypothetical protein
MPLRTVALLTTHRLPAAVRRTRPSANGEAASGGIPSHRGSVAWPAHASHSSARRAPSHCSQHIGHGLPFCSQDLLKRVRQLAAAFPRTVVLSARKFFMRLNGGLPLLQVQCALHAMVAVLQGPLRFLTCLARVPGLVLYSRRGLLRLTAGLPLLQVQCALHAMRAHLQGGETGHCDESVRTAL